MWNKCQLVQVKGSLSIFYFRYVEQYFVILILIWIKETWNWIKDIVYILDPHQSYYHHLSCLNLILVLLFNLIIKLLNQVFNDLI